MKENSLLNAIAVLRRKPAVLLLLFPLHAFAPMLFLLLPAFHNFESIPTSEQGFFIMLLVVAAVAFLFFYIIVRAVFLISPSMELLRDGAAGLQTKPGWYARALKKHWWKAITVGFIERSVSYVVTYVMQFGIIMIFPLALIPGIITGSYESGSSLSAVLAVLLMAAFAIVVYAILYAWESLCAFILAALADRSVGKALSAVFSKRGMKKFLALLGGRLLIGAGIFVVSIVSLFVCGLINGGAAIDIQELTFSGVLPLACVITACLLVVSALEIYRFAYDFCVFQKLKDSGPDTLPTK